MVSFCLDGGSISGAASMGASLTPRPQPAADVQEGADGEAACGAAQGPRAPWGL